MALPHTQILNSLGAPTSFGQLHYFDLHHILGCIPLDTKSRGIPLLCPQGFGCASMDVHPNHACPTTWTQWIIASLVCIGFVREMVVDDINSPQILSGMGINLNHYLPNHQWITSLRGIFYVSTNLDVYTNLACITISYQWIIARLV